MEWTDYRRVFLNYQQTVTQNRIISLLTNQILRNFPENLPKDIGVPARQALNQIIANMVKAKENKIEEINVPELGEIKFRIGYRRDEKGLNKFSLQMEDLKDENQREKVLETKLAIEMFGLISCAIGRKEKIDFKNFDFQRFNSFQSLIMHFSSFEGILADSIRVICSTRPEVMKKKRTIEWDEVLSVDSMQELIGILTDKFVREIGWQSLEERVNTFRELFGLEINLTNEEISTLKKVDLIRNLIVHNAGKANSEYLKLEPTQNLKIGDYIPISSEFLEHAAVSLQFIACDIYLEISKKYFGIDAEANTCVMKR